MTLTVTVGFVPLVDAALLVTALEEGFGADKGLDLKLVREGSWAAVRDKLTVGLFDAAHMLAPAVIASTLGLGHLRAPLVSPVGLSMNGNAITVSKDLTTALLARLGTRSGPVTPARTASVIGEIAAERRRSGRQPLVAAVVFAHSCHLYLIRRWLMAGGVNPDSDVSIVVLPPPLMADALRTGAIDLFCAGAPWNLAATASGAGHMLHPGRAIIADCPEKWLALHAARESEPWVGPLGLFDAPGQPPVEGAIRFDKEAIAPDPDRAGFVAGLMREVGQIVQPEEAAPLVAGILRPETFARSLAASSS